MPHEIYEIIQNCMVKWDFKQMHKKIAKCWPCIFHNKFTICLNYFALYNYLINCNNIVQMFYSTFLIFYTVLCIVLKIRMLTLKFTYQLSREVYFLIANILLFSSLNKSRIVTINSDQKFRKKKKIEIYFLSTSSLITPLNHLNCEVVLFWKCIILCVFLKF